MVDCKYASILEGYNKRYIVDLVFSYLLLNDTDVDYIEEVQETIIDGISSVFGEHIVINNYGASQTEYVATSGYYIVQWTEIPYVLTEPYAFFECTPPQIVPEGTFVYKANFLNQLGTNSFWYHEPPETLPVMVKMKQVIHADLKYDDITALNQLTHQFWGYKYTFWSNHIMI